MSDTTPDESSHEVHDVHDVHESFAPAADRVQVSFDDGTFTAFYRTHWDEVSRALTLALGDEQLGIEAASEGFSRACERWGTVAAYGNPKGWVYRVGLNWARSWIRRRQTERRRRERVRDGSIDALPDPDLERALAALTPQHRDVVIMRFFLDLTVAETADALDIAVGTVKSRLSRALDHLNRQLADHGEDGRSDGHGQGLR